MKTVTVCSSGFDEIKPESKYFNFSLCGKDITIGLLDDSLH